MKEQLVQIPSYLIMKFENKIHHLNQSNFTAEYQYVITFVTF